MIAISRIPTSITGQSWHWRAGNGDMSAPDFRADDLVSQILLSRGCPRDELARYRTPTIRDFMPDPGLFRDMDSAAERLTHAVMQGERIVIFGDYDVDGATSAALLIRLLRELGVDAGYYIPDRLMEGYGPSGEALVRLKQQGAQLVVTVDCGAQAFEALEMARDAGLDVIVVDHHKCATALPPAIALVNPNRLDEVEEAAAHGHLAAVGVAFLLGAALLRTLRAKGYFAQRSEPRILDLLDLVALGTVADVAQLRGLNRAFVAQGLKVMGQGRNIGLTALARVARLTRAPQCHDLGFALGPRINAGGRVGKSDLGVRLLTSTDPAEVEQLSAELDALNSERRAIEALVQEEAEATAETQGNRAIILASGHGWHPGVIGIVAGRLKEKFGRPAIVVAVDEEGTGKGSGRSITGVDLGAAILSAKDNGLLVAGGGHAMAAGLTVAEDRVNALHDYLEERLSAQVTAATAERTLLVDALLSPRGLNADLVEAMEAAGPYGTGWPSPRLVTGPCRVVKADIVGTNHLRLMVSGRDGGSFKAVAFRQAETDLGQAMLHGSRDRHVWLAGRAKVDDWNGRRSAEMHLDDAAWAD